MKIKTRESQQVTIIEMSGKLMGGTDADVFRDLIHEIIEEGKRRVLVDLAGVKWVNSTGVGILITGYTTMRRNRGDMKLLNVSNKIQSILYVTKLNLIFECFENEDEAVTSFS